MKVKNIQKMFLVFILAMSFIVVIPKIAFAGEQELNNLEFKIELTDDGDMHVEEIWDVYIYETNTLFKTFPYDDNHDGITDVSVTEIFEDGSKKNFVQKYEYAYHVDEDCYQALDNEDGMYEIAWGVAEDVGSATRKFSISYTVENCVKVFNDTAELYWKLIGEDFGINSNYIKGIIILPTQVENIEDLRVWAHGPLNGTITKLDAATVTFEVEDLPGYEFLEVRIAAPTKVFPNSTNIHAENKLNSIISEETAWAEEANLRREKAAKTKRAMQFVSMLINGVCILFFGKKFIDNIEKVKSRPKIVPEQKLKYFRDIPDEKASAIEASFVYYYTKQGTYGDIGRSLSATFMNLALKRWIEFNVVQGKKKEEIEVTVLSSGKEELTEDEKMVYDLISKVAKTKVENRFTMKEFEKYCIKNNTSFSKLIEKLSEKAKDVAVDKGKYDKSEDKVREKIGLGIAGYFFLSFAVIAFSIAVETNPYLFLIAAFILIGNFITLIVLSSRYSGVTQKCVDEAEMWGGLKKYMEEFSLIKDREVPELVLWEKYLVFATVFGIADKVIKQLKVVYPELSNPDTLSSQYAYMHIACNSNSNFNFVSSINSSIGSATNYSSGSGAGGGFSGGGGGGRRWRWRRRPLISRIN